jgi:hypothetical protein
MRTPISAAAARSSAVLVGTLMVVSCWMVRVSLAIWAAPSDSFGGSRRGGSAGTGGCSAAGWQITRIGSAGTCARASNAAGTGASEGRSRGPDTCSAHAWRTVSTAAESTAGGRRRRRSSSAREVCSRCLSVVVAGAWRGAGRRTPGHLRRHGGRSWTHRSRCGYGPVGRGWAGRLEELLHRLRQRLRAPWSTRVGSQPDASFYAVELGEAFGVAVHGASHLRSWAHGPKLHVVLFGDVRHRYEIARSRRSDRVSGTRPGIHPGVARRGAMAYAVGADRSG